VEKFGGVHVLVANAGILRDKSFQAMTGQEWDIVIAVHLRCVVLSATLAVLAYCPLQWYL
jgi:NAD(P)-dependent dehydrogenase (short-subunit alcohol dehydrogenase family)